MDDRVGNIDVTTLAGDLVEKMRSVLNTERVQAYNELEKVKDRRGLEDQRLTREIELREYKDRKNDSERILDREKQGRVFQRKMIAENSQYRKDLNSLGQLAKLQAKDLAGHEFDTPRHLNLDSEDCKAFTP